MEKKIVTHESLEMCKHCRGSGWLGTCGKYNLLCETCQGAGLMWFERARMIGSAHDLQEHQGS